MSDKYCAVCGNKVGVGSYKISNGDRACASCMKKAGYGMTTSYTVLRQLTVNDLKKSPDEKMTNSDVLENKKDISENKKDHSKLVIGDTTFDDLEKRMSVKKSILSGNSGFNIGYDEISSFKENIIGEQKKKGIGRAIAGGLIAGPAGSIVGAMTGDNYSEVSKISVSIYLTNNSTVEAMLLSAKSKSGSILYNSAIKNLNELTAKLSRITADNMTYPSQPESSSSSADELRKFKGLLDDGIITQEEFDAKKKEILGL